MKIANTLTMGPGGGQFTKLQLPAQFQKGFKCSRIRLRATASLTSTDAAAYTLTPADVLALFGYIFANWTLKFGTTQAESVDDALPFNLLRLLNTLATTRDFLVQAVSTSAAVFLNQYTTTGAQKLTVPATGGGALPFTLEAARPFVWERLASLQHDYCPGWTQMKNVQVEIQSGAQPFSADAGKVTISGNIAILVIWDTVPTSTDVWSRVFRCYRNSIAGLSQNGPGGGGGLLALAELSFPAATSPLTDIALRRTGDEAIHDIIQLQDVVREQQSVLPYDGSFDANTLATILYVTDDLISGEDIPSFDGAEFFQPNGDIAQAATLWIYLPTVDQSYTDNVIGQNALGSNGPSSGGRVLLSNNALAAGKVASANPNTAAFSPVALLTSADPQFSQLPGRFLAAGQSATNHIPTAVSTQIHAATDAAASSNSPAAADSYQASAIRRVAAAIPGSSSAMRGAVNQQMLKVAAQVGAAKGGTAGQQQAHAVTAVNRLTAFFKGAA